MRKETVAAFSIVALGGNIAFAGTAPRTGVQGSVHDMSRYTIIAPNDPEAQQGRVCAYCHTPHHAITTGNDYLPLWAHTITVLSFDPYISATIDATIDPTIMMDGPSKLCMSCHDGSIAVDTHYAFTGAKTLQQNDDLFGTPAVGRGGKLGNDHPIGFIYDDEDGGVAKGPDTGPPAIETHKQGTDDWIRNKKATYLGTNLKIADRLYISASHNGKPIMTCATCHDVHNYKNQDEAGGPNYLLLASNRNSALCLSCHIK